MFLDRLIQTLLPRSNQFFDLLINLAAKLDEASKLLESMIDADPSQFAAIAAQMRIIEHDADGVAHNLFSELDKTFVTPIDREDLVSLTSALDNVVDAIEHSAAFIAIYKTPVLTEPMKALIRIIRLASVEVSTTVTNLRQFHRPDELKQNYIRVNTLENEADIVYREAIGHLFERNDLSAVDLLRQRDLLNELELCVDSCEDVLDVVQSVVMKNG